jgi:uncharacterized protein YbaR (Trm112 family)/SAM-dependent methyltransferase
MPINIDLLACPACDSEPKLTLSTDGARLTCVKCKTSYPYRDGVPYFLDADTIDKSEVAGHQSQAQTLKSKIKAWLKPRHHSIYFDRVESSYNNGAKLEEFLQSFDKNQHVVNVGSLSKLVKTPGASIYNLDISAYPHVDIIADAHQMPFSDDSLDGIVIKNVFEHIRDPIRVRNELERVLRKGGRIYAKVPFLQPFHAVPDDYQRYTINGLHEFFKHFKVLEEGISIGPSSAMSWMLMEYFGVLFSFNTETGARIARHIGSFLFFWVKYLDIFLRNNKKAHVLASAFYLVLEKKEAETTQN